MTRTRLLLPLVAIVLALLLVGGATAAAKVTGKKWPRVVSAR
jgi:hypothetical protein